jgi:hypothetical protein
MIEFGCNNCRHGCVRKDTILKLVPAVLDNCTVSCCYTRLHEHSLWKELLSPTLANIVMARNLDGVLVSNTLGIVKLQYDRRGVCSKYDTITVFVAPLGVSS